MSERRFEVASRYLRLTKFIDRPRADPRLRELRECHGFGMAGEAAYTLVRLPQATSTRHGTAFELVGGGKVHSLRRK